MQDFPVNRDTPQGDKSVLPEREKRYSSPVIYPMEQEPDVLELIEFDCKNGKSVGLPRWRLRSFLATCWRETYVDELGADTTSALIATLEDDDLGGILPSVDERVVLVFRGQQIVGSCVYAARGSVAYVWGCYISLAVQRSGIGRSLIRHILCAGLSTERLQVTVLCASRGAIAFYESLGFAVVNQVNFELLPGCKEPALIMDHEIT
jgi:ribosomal protein S18 acetylase RimI-like enzyme